MTGKRKNGNGEGTSAGAKKPKSSIPAPDIARRSSRLIDSQDKANNGKPDSNSPRIRKAPEKAASNATTTIAASKDKNGVKSTGMASATAVRGRPKKSSLETSVPFNNPKIKGRKAAKTPIVGWATSDEDNIDMSEHSIRLESISPEDHEVNQESRRKSLDARLTTSNWHDSRSGDEEVDDDTPNYWLMKAEPESRIEKGVDVKFGIDDLMKVDMEGWDGVRNAVARSNMRQMLKGDLAFFYHSNCKKPGIAGIMEVVIEHTTDGKLPSL